MVRNRDRRRFGLRFGYGLTQRRRTAGLAPQVIFVIARIDVHVAVFDLEDARGQVVDEVAVVRNKDHRAGVARQRLQQHVLGAHVQVIGGLVEQ